MLLIPYCLVDVQINASATSIRPNIMGFAEDSARNYYTRICFVIMMYLQFVHPFKIMPWANSLLLMAVATAGTAKPSAHGHVMINTATATLIAKRMSPLKKAQKTNAASARTCTAGA